MNHATTTNTTTTRRVHPAVVHAALRSFNRRARTAKQTDANGSTSSPQARSYVYDTESGRVAAQQPGTHRPTPCGCNRLVEVHDANNAIVATYSYDPFGRRISKTVNGQTAYYFYAAEGLIAEADATGQITRTYGYAPGSTFE